MQSEHVRALIEEDRDTLIQAWSIQHRCAISCLEAGRYTASYDFVDPRRMDATRWMASEMRRRGMPLKSEEAPIWVFFEKPLERSDIAWREAWTEEHKLLSLAIPRIQMLVSFHFPWASRFLGMEDFTSPLHPPNANPLASCVHRKRPVK